MRREFNKELLVTTYIKTEIKKVKAKKPKPPKKRGRKRKPIQKTDKRRSLNFELFMNKYIDQIGQNWDSKELARICGVKESAVYKWTIGYKPLSLVRWNIARYISSHLNPYRSIETKIYKELEQTLKESK